jgi:NAD+ synthase (glutamine-hydrolysing)
MTVVVGTLEREADLYNVAAVLHDGQWLGNSRKRYLPNYGVFDENRYFHAERHTQVFRRGDVTFGVNVCEDIWIAGGPSEEQAVRGGAEVILNCSASPYHAGKADERRRMLGTRAADNLAIVAFVNLVGGQDEVVFDGASLIVDADGHVLAEGAMFAEDLVVADLDLDEVFNARLHDTRLRKERDLDEDGPLPRIDLPLSAAGGGGGTATRVAVAPRPPRTELEPAAEVYAALSLGVRDYVGKNGFETVVLGLSGGIDSALTACIAVDSLGAGRVVGVSMPSEFTSAESLSGAEALAKALGIRFHTVPIRDVVRGYEAALAPVFAGRAPDTTEENLQARIRGNYLMALSNKFGWMVLTTGNKSETSVGYSTLYGDTAGGFAVLKDVYKTQV